ncbi:universal stress protein [Geobacter sp. SVR]|uniref:universal stress protein n=1 Tax=Geobacter sp. SVR TaxID=2495594 RepID=UPI00143EF6F3|nr:universal stress protein [Geobacter sp. SVR]BCS55790.1 universal stress protein A [Geobacter sp. SVR]GCF83794.1 universal stress protein A [Geobacter sp. SVR]
MSFKDILLYLDDSPHCERRIDVALSVAQAQGARVNGLSIVTHGYYQPRYLRAEEKVAAAAALLMAKARNAAVPCGCRRIESSAVGVGKSELMIKGAHCSDVVIVSQESPRVARTAAIVEPLVVRSGRPVLIVPVAGSFPTIGRRVLVAWKNGREAARALHDALPILRQAEQVTLLTIASEEESHQHYGENIREHLGQHTLQARTELFPVTSATLADTLLNRVSEGGYDLLVMGAYSPGARRGSGLGQVAGQILREMTVPVLMSH